MVFQYSTFCRAAIHYKKRVVLFNSHWKEIVYVIMDANNEFAFATTKICVRLLICIAALITTIGNTDVWEYLPELLRNQRLSASSIISSNNNMLHFFFLIFFFYFFFRR